MSNETHNENHMCTGYRVGRAEPGWMGKPGLIQLIHMYVEPLSLNGVIIGLFSD